jgi:hypothetical protein
VTDAYGAMANEEKFYLLAYKTVWSVASQPTFRRTTWRTASALQSHARNSHETSSHDCSMRVYCLADSSTLKLGVTCSSETSVDFQQTTQCYMPEDITLHNHHCKNRCFYAMEREDLQRETEATRDTSSRITSPGMEPEASRSKSGF